MGDESSVPCGLPGLAVALVPAYNPSPALVGLVEELTALGFEVVVVDDGSSPPASEVFSAVEAVALVLRHPDNRGKGEALRTGMGWIFRHYPPETMVVTVDADGQHRPHDAVGVCLAGFSRTGPASEGLVLGVRFDDDGTPVRSRVGHLVSRLAFRLATGRRLVDTQTGLRAFRAGMVPRLVRIPGQRYEYEMNQLLAVAGQRIPFIQVPIETVYDRNNVSHYRGLLDSFLVGRAFLSYAVGGRFLRRSAPGGHGRSPTSQSIPSAAFGTVHDVEGGADGR